MSRDFYVYVPLSQSGSSEKECRGEDDGYHAVDSIKGI